MTLAYGPSSIIFTAVVLFTVCAFVLSVLWSFIQNLRNPHRTEFQNRNKEQW